MNDGLRTDIFLRYPAETIACACIHLAARTLEKPVALPKNPSPWFEIFDATERDINSICQVLLELYTKKEVIHWCHFFLILYMFRLDTSIKSSIITR